MAQTPLNRGRIELKDPTTIDECWIQVADYSFLSGFTDDQIIEACAEINDLCNRKFNHQVADMVLIGEETLYYDYNTFTLDNYPIKSVSDIYLQILDTFSQLDTTYLQIFSEEGTIKLVPILSANTNSSLPEIDRNQDTSIWVRYDSGFRVNGDSGTDYPEVPQTVKKATALMAKYLNHIENLPIGVKSFSTRTYSQSSSAGLSDDPYYTRMMKLLDKFIVRQYA